MSVSVQFTTTRDGVRIAHTSAGEGPPLVFARGWITHLEHNLTDPSFAAFLDQLTRGARVIRYDGRGNGLSDRSLTGHVDLDALVADLESVMDAQQVDTAMLWGSSWGGPAAVAYAARHPERVSHLVLDGTFAKGGQLATPEQREELMTLWRMARRQPDAVFAAISYMTDPEPGGSHDRRVERLRRSIDADSLVTLYGALYDLDVEEEAARVEAPTLVVHRRDSRAVRVDHARQLAALIPDARLVVLEGRAHNLWEGDPAEALTVLGRFLGLVLAPADLPQKRVSTTTALMFTDIVDSTALNAQWGDDHVRTVIRHHDAVVRAALAQFSGRQVKHTGDGMMAVFGSVSQALAAAVAIQATFTEADADVAAATPVVRIGLSVGEPVSEDDDYFGLVVSLAARSCQVAPSGGIAVTGAVRDMALGKGFRFAPLGEHSLKGFDDPIPLWEVVWRGTAAS
jgi:pimeloyl-ACP methyl ester carboxylesterase